MTTDKSSQLITYQYKEGAKEKTDFLQYLFQTSPAFFMSIGADGKTMFMSEELLQLMGYSLEDVIGKDYVGTFVPPEERKRLTKAFQILRKSHQQIFDENCLITKDGQKLFVKWQWWPVFNPDNEFDFYFGVGSDITEFIKSEETLKKKEAHYRVLAENVLDVIWTVDMDLRFTYISPSITSLLGYSVQDILGYPLERVLTPQSLNAVKKTISEELTISRKEPFRTQTVTLEFKHKNGLAVETENRLDFIYDSKGRPIGILIVTRDFNDRKEKEEKLRDEILHTLFDDSPNPIFVTDDSGRHLDINRAGQEFLECRKESLLGKKVKNFDPELLKKQIRLFPGYCTVENNYFVNGITKTLLLSVFPITLSNRSILFWIGQDISTRKQAEEALKRSEEKYRLLIENQTDMVVKMDAGIRFLFVSPSFCKLFGKQEKDVLGKSFMIFVHKEDRENIAKAMKRLYAPPYTCFVEHRAIIKSKMKWIAWSFKAICDRKGNVDTIVGGGRDITKRKTAEEEKENIQNQLLQAQKMEAIGTLAGGIAHDFNNLMTVVKGHSEFVLKKMAPDNPFYENLQEIIKAAKNASLLTGQLLAFSRRQMFQPILMDINSLIKDVEKMIGRLIGEDIHLKSQIDESPSFIKADPTQMTQVIMNLAVNARDSMPGGGRLIIKTERLTIKGKDKRMLSGGTSGNFLCLTIQDTGIGIDQEILPHIFEPFFTTKKQGEGTGLGLSVVYGIIKQHNGWIDVETEVNQGTAFQIYLPAVSLMKSTEIKKDLNAYKGQGERILLVEDESAVRKYVTEALQENGYMIFDASTAKEALDLFDRESGKFDLILSDVVLPEINGLQLVELLLLRKAGLKVLMTSGYMDKKSQWPIIKARGFHFLQKPFDSDDLFKAVREALT